METKRLSITKVNRRLHRNKAYNSGRMILINTHGLRSAGLNNFKVVSFTYSIIILCKEVCGGTKNTVTNTLNV